MSHKILLASLAALVAVLLVGILSLGSPENKKTPAAAVAAPAPGKTVTASESTAASSEKTISAPASNVADSTSSPIQSEKDSTLIAISDASANLTDDSVKIVKPYLLSSDLEVRRAAVEAMKQLSLPSAAKALREAADRSNSPTDKAEFIKAAEFVELPPYVPRSKRLSAGS
jgi:hypothetical protein